MCKISILNFDEGYMKKLLIICFILTLTGCDVAYKSYSVGDNVSANIQVIQLTPETVLKANSSPYEPLMIPDLLTTNVRYGDSNPMNNVLLESMLKTEKKKYIIETGFPEPLHQKPYLIGVGDVVMLSTPQADNIVEAINGILASQNKRQGYTVQDDGAVSIPDIGRIVIGGLSLEEAEDAIYRQLLEMGIPPSFSIEVAEFNSQRVSVVGAVVNPGIEPITLQSLFLDELISRRGGITISDSSFAFIQLHRNGSVYQINFEDLYNQNKFSKILLTDGDRVVVNTTNEYDNFLGFRQKARFNSIQENEMNMWANANASKSVHVKLEHGAIPREYVYIIGEVGAQSRFILPFADKAVLADAILESGGVLPLSGNPKQIYLLRGAYEQAKFEEILAFHLDATNAANFLLATRLELRPKDVIFVGMQPITNWNRIINQIMPSFRLSGR